MKVSHADFSKVSRVIFVEVRAVVMLTTCHAASSRMLTVFAYASMAGGDVAAAVRYRC